MPGPDYPVSVEIEGRRYTGRWTLKQGGKVCIMWPAAPPRLFEVEPGQRPEDAAKAFLRRVVEDWLEEQRRPPQKPAKARRPAPKSEAEEEPAKATLRQLVAEIAAADYRDPLGHQLVNNTAYLEAVALLDLMDQLER